MFWSKVTTQPVELLGLLLHGKVEDLCLVEGLSLGLQVRGKLGASLVKLTKLSLQLVSGVISLGQTGLRRVFKLGGGLIGYVKSKPLGNGQIISIDVLVDVMIIAVFHKKLI